MRISATSFFFFSFLPKSSRMGKNNTLIKTYETGGNINLIFVCFFPTSHKTEHILFVG